MYRLMLLLAPVLAAQIPADQSTLAQGEKVFARNCTDGPCHGAAGEAGKAPRLRGRGMTGDGVRWAVHEGVPSSNMHQFKARLGGGDLAAVVAYVTSIQQASSPSKKVSGGPAIHAQAQRGEALFFDAAPGVACGTCHALAGRGTAVAPDLARWARMSPRAILIAINATRTEYTQAITLKAGSTFPGLKASQDDKSINYYDLSVTPPALRQIPKVDIASTADNSTWRHPPGATGYTAGQLADIIAFVRWAAYGDTKGVKEEEVQ